MNHIPEEALLAEIMRALEIDHQYTRWFDAHSEFLVAQVRSCGRRAGRALGYKVRTFATDPALREDSKCVVSVVVIESTDEDEGRILERSQLLITDAMSRILG